MKQVDEARMHDIKAAMAAEIASLCDRGEKVASVAGTLRVDGDEARRLMARGRRLARQKGEKV